MVTLLKAKGVLVHEGGSDCQSEGHRAAVERCSRGEKEVDTSQRISRKGGNRRVPPFRLSREDGPDRLLGTKSGNKRKIPR